MRVLCVAEKNSVGKGVAQILSNGRMTTRNTKFQYIKNYDFKCNLSGEPCDVTMTALSGHLVEIDFQGDARNWNSVDPVDCFDEPVHRRVPKTMQDIKDNLVTEARGARMLVIWTDCDLEGECIGFEVVEVCRRVRPQIIVKRAKFSVVQPRQVSSAWSHLVEIDMRQVDAVDARRELDLRIGAAFTRFQTMFLKNKFPELDEKAVVSFGSCQFPTLGFITEQYEKVKNFRPEQFWKIEVSIERGSECVVFNWARYHLFDHRMVLGIYEKCMTDPIARITMVTSKPTEKWRPLPLTTVDMLKFCSTYFKMSSDKTVKIAEDLYTKGYISYPRTETDIFDESIPLHDLIDIQKEDDRWSIYCQRLQNGGFRFPRNGKNNDMAHPPIHPTKVGHELEGDAKKIYEFIARRFLACCSDNAKGLQTSIEIEIAEESFSASGLVITERNYLDIYIYDKWSENSVPNFALNERMLPSSIEMKGGSTTGPSCLNEAELIGIMEKHGIGTDATIAQHIKMVQDRNFANKENSRFLPTTLGMGLIQGYRRMDLELSMHKPYMRSLMEANIKSICSGRKTKDAVINESVKLYRGAFEQVNESRDVLLQALRTTFG